MFTVADVKGDYTGEYIDGNFYCTSLKLISLEGAPLIVGGVFNCSYNYFLESLKYSPRIVGGDFICIQNDLESLEDAPKSIGGDIRCDEYLLNGENLYIIANALLNGKKDKPDFEEEALKILTEYFI